MLAVARESVPVLIPLRFPASPAFPCGEVHTMHFHTKFIGKTIRLECKNAVTQRNFEYTVVLISLQVKRLRVCELEMVQNRGGPPSPRTCQVSMSCPEIGLRVSKMKRKLKTGLK
jgi:hypothetical protein